MTASRRVILHIGAHKTGSTSIQESLARAETFGRMKPARYPLLGADREHHRLLLQYLPYERWRIYSRGLFADDERRRAAEGAQYRRKLFDQLRTTNRAILSSEGFVALEAGEISGLREDLERSGFDEFRIVLYARDPADHYLSEMQEILKGSTRVKNPVNYRLPVRKWTEEWEENFPGCVAVQRFSASADFDVVADFSEIMQDFLGVRLPPSKVRSNASLSAEGMAILHHYRQRVWPDRNGQPTDDTDRLIRLLRQSKSVVPQTQPQLRPEIAAWIRANNRDDLSFIAERYGVDLRADTAEVREPLELDREDLRIRDVLQRVDDDTVTDLLLELVKSAMEPPMRPFPVRITKRVLRGRVVSSSAVQLVKRREQPVSGRMILHIGTHKTGSTSIQRALALAEVSGDLRPVRYPVVDGDDRHHRLAWSYLPYQRWRPNERAGYPADNTRRAAMFDKYRRAVFGQLRTTKRAVLSSEGFVWLSADEIRLLRKDLEDAGFDEFRVVVYVRDPADYYLSATQEDIKRSCQVENPMAFKYRVRHTIDAWEEIFPGSLCVRQYFADPSFNVVPDFSGVVQDYLGVKLPPAQLRANVSMSAEGMEILQRYRLRFWSHCDDMNTPDSLRLVDFVQRTKTTIPQTQPQLRPEIAAWIRANNRDDLSFIAECYGVDLRADTAEVREPLELDREDLRVRDVLQRVDDDTVTDLLLELVKSASVPTKRALPVRIAKRVLPGGITRRLVYVYRSARPTRRE